MNEIMAGSLELLGLEERPIHNPFTRFTGRDYR
jgi:hypothetical protein